jgi:hypothetical protein
MPAGEESRSQGESEGEGVVALRLVIEPGEPLTGAIGVDGGATNTQFSGWVELMAAVNAARGRSSTGSS